MLEYNGQIKPLKNDILVVNMERGRMKTKGGVFLPHDDTELNEKNIKPRWAQVWKMGEDLDMPFEEGDWILVEHGRWSRIVKLKEGDKIYEFQKVDHLPHAPWDIPLHGIITESTIYKVSP